MRTTKPFSTISYNTPAFLTSKLDELIQKRILSFYVFVRHYAEEDEKKDHIHLLCIPNGQINTDSISDYLVELDPSDPLGLPLGVMPWRSSNFDDWYLYASHDTEYLITKNQTRQHHYPESDFVSPIADYLHELIVTIDRSRYAKTKDFVDRVKLGVPLREMVEKGQIPVNQFSQWAALYAYMQQDKTHRDGRESHSPAYFDSADPDPISSVCMDTLTGEVVSEGSPDDEILDELIEKR